MLVQAYIIVLLLLIVLLSFYIGIVNRQKSESSQSMTLVLVSAIGTVIANLIFIIAKNENTSTFGFSLFSALIDWLLLFLLAFVIRYTEKEEKWTGLFKMEVFISVIDTVSLLLNVLFHHVFRLQKNVFLHKYEIYVAQDFTIYYYLHLMVCYVLVFRIIFLLLHKAIRTSSVYRKKYSVVLGFFSIVILLDAVCVILHIPLNVSIVFYGLLEVAISYYWLFYQPKQLLTDMQVMILEHSKSGIVCFDDKGQCMYVNDGLFKMFHLERNQENYNKIRYQKNENHENLIGPFAQWNEEYIISGEKRYIEIERQNLYDKKGIFVGCYFTLNDRTQQQHFYEMQIDAANESNRAKSEFLSRVSHDIRTPVNSIFGMNEMILRESKSSDISNYAARIKEAVNVLLGIINDVLDFSKIEAGKMTLVERAYDTKKMLSGVIDIISVQAEKKDLEFTCDLDDTIPKQLFGDEIRIQQVLINLLSNAVKYTNTGKIVLHVGCQVDDETANLQISVEDTGIGIQEEDIPKLFNAFERFEEVKNHSIQGTGLGLNITNYLLKLMHSALTIKSVYGKGSSFSFSLQQRIIDKTPFHVQIEEKQQEKYEYQPLFTAPGARILVVDDNDINRFVFISMLGSTKIQLEEASSGQECLYLTTQKKYDMIFMDHMMPEMDGIETFHKLRADLKNPCHNVPVVILTANVVVGAKEMYLQEGFDGYLTKPFEPEDVEQMIMKLLPLELVEHTSSAK